MGRHPNYTSRLLARDAHLRIDQLFDILGALGDDPADFFYELHQRLGGSHRRYEAATVEAVSLEDEAVTRFMQVIAQTGGERALERLVDRRIDERLGELAGAKRVKPR